MEREQFLISTIVTKALSAFTRARISSFCAMRADKTEVKDLLTTKLRASTRSAVCVGI